ncbi:tetratricopeptide repeat protein [Breoghania sp.]|uniref:tetratricopeptide repeat protein n=1 Tax=Breoghania sp. TaxID=2065378 RepID=UPI0029C8D444|nr:tetratricopeptide repeat protein [Breoghania sp.]
MNIKPWQILCFLAVIIGTSILVFPGRKEMLPRFIENGDYGSARAILEKMLADSPLDTFANNEAVRLDLLEGHPDRAIDRLESLDQRSSLTADQWERLAVLYEWGRRPQKALGAWERLLGKEPGNRAALIRLIGYYRYRGDFDGESRAIVRLIRLEGADGKWRENGKRLADLIAAQLNQLNVPDAPEPVEPLTAMLASGLYQLYERGMDRPADGDPSASTEIYRCLEQFVWTGHPALGRAFAQRADRAWQTGIEQALRLVEVLGWSRMDREALDLLGQLREKAPEDQRVLMAMARIADRMADPAAGIALYEELIRLDPAEPVFRQRLAALALQTGQTATLFDDYERRYAATANPRLIHEMLELALPSGDPDLQMRALRFVEQAGADDPRSLKLRANLYLSLDQPENAYPLLKLLATGPGATAADLESMLRVAGYTDRPAIMVDALASLEQAHPDDPALLDRIAGGWLSADHPREAYRTMRRLTALTGNRPGNIRRTLDMAWHTGDPDLIGQAAAWAMELAPDEPFVSDGTIRLYLSIGQPEKAYAIKAAQVRRQRAVSQVPSLLALAESTGRLELMADAIGIGLTLAPQNPDLLRRMARFELARSKEPEAIAAFERYLRLKPGDQEARLQLAQLYEWQNQPEKALDLYRRIVRDDPRNKAAADALARLTNPPAVGRQTLALLKKRVDDDPQNAALALAAGRALVAEGQLKEGGIYLQRAADLAPEDPAIWLELADVYEWTGQTDRLIDVLDRLAASGSLDRRRTLLLADAYLARRHWSRAAALLQPLTKQAAIPHREGLMLLEAYSRTDRHKEAEDLILRLKAENASDPVFLADLGQQAQWGRRLDLALDIFEAVLRQDPENLKALKGSGQVYAWTGRPESAIRFLKTYNRLFPEDHETRYLLGEVYLAVHRDAEAQKEFRAAKRLIEAAKAENGTAAGPTVRKGTWP